MADNETIFHQIAQHKIPADIVFEDEHLCAFRDINPVAPIHILVIPKKTIQNLSDISGEDTLLLGHMMSVCSLIAQREGLAEDGWRLVANTGDNGGQTVDQLHFHILGGRRFSWPPG